MCNFCKPMTIEEWKEFKEWKDCNPYNGDEQVDDEGIRYALKHHKFFIAAKFDGGYIADEVELKFRFCPVCGRPL